MVTGAPYQFGKSESKWNCLYCIFSVAVVISQCEYTLLFFLGKSLMYHMHRELKDAMNERSATLLLICTHAEIENTLFSFLRERDVIWTNIEFWQRSGFFFKYCF